MDHKYDKAFSKLLDPTAPSSVSVPEGFLQELADLHLVTYESV